MTTSIEWAGNPDGSPGETWNPVRGCHEISPGCAHCYAKTFAERFRGVKGHPYEQGFDLRLVPEKLAHPLKFKKPTTFFVNSMSDLWHEDVPDEYIAACFGVMAATPQHRYITLTKREDRLVDWYTWHKDQACERDLQFERYRVCEDEAFEHIPDLPAIGCLQPWPLPNVWVGVSVENRKHGVPRIDKLRQVPAALRVLSIEPLLEDLGEIDLTGIGWVLIGGESGRGARISELAWYESLLRQCAAQGVPAFMKQLGAAPALSVEPTGEFRTHKGRRQVALKVERLPLLDRKGGNPAEWPAHLRVRQMPEVRHG